MNTAATTATALNSVDYMIITIFAFSMLAGFLRGFLKEIISLVTWVVASFASSMFAGKLAAYFTGASSSATSSVGSAIGSAVGTSVNLDQSTSMIAIAGSFVAIFIATLIIGFIISTIATSAFQAVGLSLPNRLLGTAFGALRGLILVVVMMFLAELTPMGDQVAWVQSQFVHSLQPIVNYISELVKPGVDLIKSKADNAVKGMSGQMDNMKNTFQGQ